MAGPAKSTRSRKKVKKHVTQGDAHIHASFNNTIITFTDRQGNTLCWATSGGSDLPRIAMAPSNSTTSPMTMMGDVFFPWLNLMKSRPCGL